MLWREHRIVQGIISVLAALHLTTMTGCATLPAQMPGSVPSGATQYACFSGGAPLCYEYMGRKIQCSCADRATFERLFDHR